MSTAPACRTNALTTLGFVLYCVYLLSGFLNDWSMMLFGHKAYLSTVSLIVLPVLWVFSGNAVRGLHHSVGFCWLAFIFWLMLAAPFSIWKGGSARMLLNVVPKSYLCLFYACSFVTSIRRCRFLMYINIVGSVLLLLACSYFGASTPDATRFQIPDSLFYANANDLALTLLLGATPFLFLFPKNGIVRKFVGSAGIMLCTLYGLKTGSRGCLIAGAGFFAAVVFFSRSKLKVVLVSAPILVLTPLALPGNTLHRLSLVFGMPGQAMVETCSDEASLASEFQREGLLRKSLDYTLAHPLFGVGPDQFATAVFGEAAGAGQNVPWLGTHNTYTQISSECGIPALLFYCAAILLCLRSNYRLYAHTRNNPAHREIAGLSLSLLAATLVYAVSLFFFHIAYSTLFPALAGFSAALDLSSSNTRTPASRCTIL